MSDRRQLKSYRIILQAHQHEIDRLSADLSAIRAEQASIQGKIDYLQHRRDTEGFAASLEAAPFVAGFLQAISAEQVALHSRLDSLSDVADQLEEQVRSKYLELQSWRLSCDRLQARIDYDKRRKEDAELDEVARTIFTFNAET